MKVIFYVVGGTGLGHLNRGILIANEVKKIDDKSEFLFITNCPFTLPLEENEFHHILLDETKELDDKSNFDNIIKIVNDFDPDLIFWDSSFFLSVLKRLEKTRIKNIFVWRKFKNNLIEHRINSGVLDYFDHVLIPHSKSELLELGLENKTLNSFVEDKKVFFLGSIVKKSVFDGATLIEKYDIKKDDFLLVVTVGGGGDPKVDEFFSLIDKSLVLLNEKIPNLKVLLFTGPLYGGDYKFSFENLGVCTFEKDIISLFKLSNLVISFAGYNTLNEIISSKVPALLCPVDKVDDDQFERVNWLVDKGVACSIEGVGSKELYNLVFNLYSDQKKLSGMKTNYSKFNFEVDSLKINNCFSGFFKSQLFNIPKQPPKSNCIAYLKNPFLNYSEFFIYDEIRTITKFRKIVFTTRKFNEQIYNGIKIYSNPSFSELHSRNYPYINKRQKKAYEDLILYYLDIINKENVKILHAQFGIDALFYIPLKKASKLPLVVSFRGNDIYAFPRDNPSVYNPLFNEADLFLVRSDMMKMDLIKLGCSQEKIIVHHSSVNTSNYHFKKRDLKDKKRINLLFIGRLVEKKGIFDLLGAMEILSKSSNSFFLTIFGGGLLDGKIRDYISQKGLSNKISLNSHLSHDDLVNELNKHDILVLPSKKASDGDQEGIPVILMEAMASGLLVVSTKHSGIPELIQDNINGFLVDEGDFLKLAEKIKSVVRIEDLIKIERNALKVIETQFNIDIQSKILEQLYFFIIKKQSDKLKECNYLKISKNNHSFNMYTNKFEEKLFFFRADDIYELSLKLKNLIAIFIGSNIPLDLSIIPGKISNEAVEYLLEVKGQYPNLIHFHQHGYNHTNHSNSSKSYEFGGNRGYMQQFNDIKMGQSLMIKYFKKFDNIFTPPNHNYDLNTLRALDKLDFDYFSSDSYLDDNHYKFKEIPISIDIIEWGDYRRVKDYRGMGEELNYVLSTNKVIGFVLHHELFETMDFSYLSTLIRKLKQNNKYRFVNMIRILDDSNNG